MPTLPALATIGGTTQIGLFKLAPLSQEKYGRQYVKEPLMGFKKFIGNGKESTVNRALGGSTYPS